MKHLNKNEDTSKNFESIIDSFGNENKLPNIVSDNLGETLESIRREKGLNKQDFASLGKISQSYYSELINNKKKPNLDTLEKFCINIRVPLHILIFKAMIENDFDNDKKRLIREIKPLFDKITEILYEEEEKHNKVSQLILEN